MTSRAFRLSASHKLSLALATAGSLFLASGCSGSSPDGGKADSYCSLPKNAKHSDTVAAYAHWKETLLTSEGAGGFLRVRRPNSKGAVVNSTVSEGIAYGMLASVYMDDPETFDALFKYSLLHLDANGLMHWYIGPDGEVLGQGGATDSDEDIAYALLQASKKWGGKGSLEMDYLEYAKKQIDLVWQFEIDKTGEKPFVLPGDSWGTQDVLNPSYFAPAFYRAFERATGNKGWLEVAASSYDVIEAALNEASGNRDNGLVPAWCTRAGVPTHNPQHFQFDSCRTPFRIAQDYCAYGEKRAKDYLAKITGFYEGIGLEHLVDGFDLNGTPHPEFSVDGSRAAAFVGPAGVGALYDSSHAGFVEDVYTDLVTKDALIIGDSAHDNQGSIYYNTSWRVLSLLVLDGTYKDLTLE